MPLKVLVTGATGFVGTALIQRLVEDGRFDVRGAVRRETDAVPAGVDRVVVGDLTPEADWQQAVAGIDAVVHLAARVHVMRETVADPLAEFRRVNVAGSLNLARQAAAAGVSRFVFVSSVKVHGESGLHTESAAAAPVDAYGISKHEAEMGLTGVSGNTGMPLVIIRPPLAYGRGVKGNFQALMRAVARGIPLPVGTTENRRSLVALDNLVDFILTGATHPSAVNQTFLVSDDDDRSIADLIRGLARAMGCRPRLIPVPARALMAGAALLGKRDAAQRLLGSLQVDISKAHQLLGWVPPISMDEGLRRVAASRR